MSRSLTETGSFKPDQESFSLESVDDRMIGLMRLILALSALIIIYIDPAEPDRFVAITYGALLAYTFYSGVLYVLSLRSAHVMPIRTAHWVDVGCFLIIVAISSGTNSIFFFFFFFAILVASFRRGFRSGFRVTLCSALLFTVVGYATAPARPNFELNRFLLRPVYLLVLGYMIAYWGGREIRLKQRLRLLKEITRLSNPRFGVSQTIGSILRRLQVFYDANLCAVVMTDLHPDEPRLFRLERDQPTESVRAERMPASLARLMLSLPEEIAVVYKGDSSLSRNRGDYVSNVKGKRVYTAEWREISASLAAKLDADCFVSVPLYYRGNAIGRLYLMARRGAFDGSDVDFLMQLIEQFMPILHNIRLLARLASNAADHERQRLARDIHDSVIQPYIGLQYKVAAIRNKMGEGQDVTQDVERLFQMTVDEIKGLRGFVSGLKDPGGSEPSFLSAVRRFAAEFADNYQLEVKVESKGEIDVNGRLAAELIQIVHEGLSNVRKHTRATTSRVALERVNSRLILRIENDGGAEDEASREPFVPASITERAEELGGRVRVERGHEGRTLVRVEIPL